MRYLVIVDGDHYPPVVAAALEHLLEQGHAIAGVVLAGGAEKLPTEGAPAYGVGPLRTGPDPALELDRAIADLAPEAVLDLADEPVLDYRRRHELAAVALARSIAYEGADFAFTPPQRPKLSTRPSIAIIGTGKRTGKTAIAGLAARSLKGAGYSPVLVAMGRGGPAEPEVLRGDRVALAPTDLVALADAGKHAASDYIEDALTARVPTVGGHRCGGGLAGAVAFSNMGPAIAMANQIEGDITILEGSGSALPPAHSEVTALVVPASVDMEFLRGYMGPYRLLLSDFILVTMCEEPFGSPSQISAIRSLLRESFSNLRKGGVRAALEVVHTVFRPAPLGQVGGASVFVVTTAPQAAGGVIKRHLEDQHGCKVLGVSHALADRQRLKRELDTGGKGADVLLCELKAAAVDVATRWALDSGVRVVYMDNVAEGVDGADPSLMFVRAAELAAERFEKESI